MILAWETYHWFLVLGAPLIALELLGAFAWDPKGPGGGDDTISEMWWHLRNKYPFLLIPMLAFLGWLIYHFTFEGWRRRRNMDDHADLVPTEDEIAMGTLLGETIDVDNDGDNGTGTIVAVQELNK